MNYYNENDPFCVEWLWNLIDRGMISNGIVDNRSIKDVTVGDLDGFDQCHFFAGIGVWSYALTLAGWPDDRPVWTGSCPCQPFSAAGQRKGFKDDRHLWPEWFRLIRESRPVAVFGEQVSSALSWLDLVSGDLEGEGYAVGSAIMGAHSVGAPHIRQRLYFVADSECARWTEGRTISRNGQIAGSGLAHAPISDEYEWTPGGKQSLRQSSEGSVWLADATNPRRPGEREYECRSSLSSSRSSEYGGMGNTTIKGLEEWPSGTLQRRQSCGEPQRSIHANFWETSDKIWCLDGRSRPVEPSTFPLAHGSPNRVGRLRGYGNALVAPQAAAFIEAYMALERY